MHSHLPTLSTRYESLGVSGAGGTTVTASATPNTVKGSWASLGTTAFDWQRLIVQLGQASAAGDQMVDIATEDASGNKSILVPDLHFPATRFAAEPTINVGFDIAVPSGKIIYARSAASVASLTSGVSVMGTSNGPGGKRGGSRAIALFSPATSKGPLIDGHATVSGSKGSWVPLLTPTSRIVQLNVVFGSSNDTARADVVFALDIGVGATGAESVLVPNIRTASSSSNDVIVTHTAGPFDCDVPASVQFSARLAANTITAGDRALDLCLYGVLG